MKMFRPALAGILPGLVLLVAIQFSADAASTSQPPAMQSWSTGDGTVSHHPWLSVSTSSDGAPSFAARLKAPSQARQLSFEDRVAYQRAIEAVYWRHRIWPKERPDPKPSLDAVMSRAAIEKKVQDYLRDSELLEAEWQKPITSEQLQAEMERMAQHTKQPEVLRELFAALDNDPFAIAECLARPVLTGRLQIAKAEEREEPSESWNARTQEQVPDLIGAANANYTLPVISGQPSDCIDDTWTATTTTGAPTGRDCHTAVWTGSEMIVWGGFSEDSGYMYDGGRYIPSTDSWTATNLANAPAQRAGHTAVWTGTEMIVWGGYDADLGTAFNTGGRYNPSTDSWTATNTINAPSARDGHTAVWTGTEMIVWGGGFRGFDTGGRYNPSTDSWTATSTTNAPTARFDQTAVWTGGEMIVWGGQFLSGGKFTRLNTGGRYNPSTDSWTATSTVNAPTARDYHTAVWTGTEMIVWGGFSNTGGRYNPSTDSWMATAITSAPTGRYSHTAVWTGNEMIIWGGAYGSSQWLNTGGRYDPLTDSWTATSTVNAPGERSNHTAVWTGSEMIVWGGFFKDINGLQYLNTGGRYCAQAGPPITLSGAGRKVGGINTVRLTWSGATSTDIDVYRNGTLIVTTSNDGTYTDSTGDTGRARYTYQVCEAGTQVCSNEATVTFPH